jgi:MYXO-CTERM domain-containing protein
VATDAYFNTTHSGVEQSGTASNSNKLALTRFFDANNNTSWLTFTLNQGISNLWLSFNQTSNHNTNFPTSPRYNFAVQIKADDVWQDIKRDLVAQNSTFGQKINLNVGSTLKAGTYQIRWIGYNYRFGNNSGTEFFGLDNVKLYTASEPAALGLLGLALLGVYRRKRQVKLQSAAA